MIEVRDIKTKKYRSYLLDDDTAKLVKVIAVSEDKSYSKSVADAVYAYASDEQKKAVKQI